MDHHPTEHDQTASVSRRSLIAGAAGAALAAGVAASYADVAGAAGSRPAAAPRPSDLAAPITGLTYLAIDAYAFQSSTSNAYYDDTSGAGGLNVPTTIGTSLTLPVGSTIRQVNIAYQGTPALRIVRRTFGQNGVTELFGPLVLAAGGGPKTQTIDLTTPIVTAHAQSHALTLAVAAGDSTYGVTLGYAPPLDGFAPYTGSLGRVLDTRDAGLTPLAAGEDRSVSFSGRGGGGASFVVFNLAVTGSAGAGFIGAYSPDRGAWPGNASLNWSAGQTISNTVICACDASQTIKLHGGVSSTHVIVDLIGFIH